MLAMQYSISLPADYDMDGIRRRVAKRGPTYDTLEHLGFKAFLITENLHELRSTELAAQQDALQSRRVHARVVALDPSTWTLARLTLWDVPPGLTHTSSIVQNYQVLHLAAPMFAACR